VLAFRAHHRAGHARGHRGFSASDAVNALRERNESLWWLTAGPVTWFAHFVLSYLPAATWCAEAAGRGGMLAPVRMAVTIYTVIALAAILATGWRGYRRYRHGGSSPHDGNTAADRHRFLGFATLLLCGLSAVATVYVTLVALLIGSCR